MFLKRNAFLCFSLTRASCYVSQVFVVGSCGPGGSHDRCMSPGGLAATGGGASDRRQGPGPSSAPPIFHTPS